MAFTSSGGMPLGTQAPDFSLPGVDGHSWALSSFDDARVLVVVFTCNHCPVARAYEDRLVDLVRDYEPRGMHLVAINPNDATTHPADSFDEMKKRAQEKGFNFPYLRDDTQEVARAYGAVCTPDVFVFDGNRQLVYAGRIDDSWKDAAKVTRSDLRAALDAILDARKIDLDVVPAMGCSIKWK